MTFDYRIDGIPCQIRVDEYHKVDSWVGRIDNCPSSDDYYGYVEIEYTVLDRKGYEAPWLQKKITEEIDGDIATEIHDYYNRE